MTKNYRNLTTEEIHSLEAQGCTAQDWNQLRVAPGFSPQDIRNGEFYGTVCLGSTEGSIEVSPGFQKHCGLRNAVLKDVTIGDNCLIENVRNYIHNYHIGQGCLISNVCAIETTPGASYGEGTVISVLNEVGDGNVMIFDGLNSQLATLMVKYEQDEAFTQSIRRIIRQDIEQKRLHVTCGTIGDHVHIVNTGTVVNCHVSDECRIIGASRLHECTLRSIPGANVTIGTGVILENSVIYDGSEILNNAKLENCFVGEACKITDGFTAENSLFFANCYMSNGEACAAFCGPFSASHHKSSLLIGGMYSFYNDGSCTNF